MQIQSLLGADIQMQFDECVKLPCSDAEAERAMRLSLRWAERSRKAFHAEPGRAIYGIVQGGANEALRIESAKALADMDFHGLAIGGLAVGEPQDVMLAMIETVVPHLPSARPRYLMGVGTPDDLIESVARGVDMFDCVMPTRAGRHGQAYTNEGRLNLRNAKYANDSRPLDADSPCAAGRDYSRAYLHHLVKSEEILAMMLLTWNNLAYYQQLMQGMRDAIAEGRFAEFRQRSREIWQRNADV
jgi:queuine tRNA-ribosyltransferase